MDKNLDNEYFITYSNHFIFEKRIFAFRRKLLFDITKIPFVVNQANNNNCIGYWINRKFLSLSKTKELNTNKEVIVDVSELQWYTQIELDLVFNL